ncbi:MAG: hypothetical protein Q4A25_00610, partial [Candidatus Saccharibacteria bacterium]|nr:hypothetical protein [Candidatus Saccharibacteria bacterium]
ETETVVEPAKTKPAAEPKPKKRVGLGILVTILILLLIGGALAIGYLWGNNTVKPTATTETNNSTTTTETTTTEEVELTDSTLKKDISDKVATLHGRKSDDGTISLGSFSTGPLGPIAYKDLSSEDKLRFVLDLLLNNNAQPLTQNERTLAESLIASNPSKYVGMSANTTNFSVENYDYYSNVMSLPIEVVEAKYYDLFGENPELLEETRGRIVEACSLYVYSEKDKSYIHFNPVGCGSPVVAGMLDFYVYSYTFSGKYVYVYIATGLSNLNDYSIHTGLDIDSPTYKKFTSVEETQNFQIDASNYQDFTKYRLVFEKNDKGTYSFKRTEKIE